MKKRLLSAALALAMVLTMLPLTALPAFASQPSEEGTTVYYYAAGKAVTGADGSLNKDAGWFYKDGKTDDGKKDKYSAVDTGVVLGTSSGKWYSTGEKALVDGKATSVKVIGDSVTFDLGKATSNLSVDANGHDVEFSGTLEQNLSKDELDKGEVNTKLNTLTVTNTGKDEKGKTKEVTVTLTNLTAQNQGFTLNLTDVKATGGVEVTLDKDVSGNLTATLTRAEVGDLTLTKDNTGTKSNTLSVTAKEGSKVGAVAAYDAKVSVTANSGAESEIKSITSCVENGTNTATPRTGATINLGLRSKVTNDVTICGQGTLTMNGMSRIEGKVKLYGAAKGDNKTSPDSLPTWKTTVTVDGTSTIKGGIAQESGDQNGHKIDIKGGSTVGEIDLSEGGKSDIDITNSYISDGSDAAALAVAGGIVDIKNSQVGDITAGKLDQTGGVTINVGTKGQADTSSVGGISKVADSGGKKAATPTLNLYGGAVGAIGAGVAHTVYGGTTASEVKKENLDTSLRDGYQIVIDGKTYTYTTDFQDLIDKYAEVGKSKFVATRVGEDVKDKAVVTFQWSDDAAASVLTELTVEKGALVSLPSTVNKTSVVYWYKMASTGQTDGDGLVPGKSIPVTDDLKLVAQLTDKNMVVTGVKALDMNIGTNGEPINATLSGTNINLSGAVVPNGNTAKIKLVFEVNGSFGEGATEQYVMVGWESKTGEIVLTGQQGDSVIGSNLQDNQVKVYDTIYTVTGTGLKAMVSHIEVGELTDIQLVVPNTTAGMSGSFQELGKLVKEEFEKSGTVSFEDATGLKTALNAQIAGLSQSSVDGYVNQARTAMVQWSNRNKDTTGRNDWSSSDFAEYDTVVLTPYLEIQCSNPTLTGDGSNTIMTLTITLKARYTVVDKAGNKVAFKDEKDSVKVPWESAANISVGDDCGKVAITLQMPKSSPLTYAETSYVHHNGQVFPVKWTDKKGTLTVTNGFNDKTFVINNTKPAANVQLTKDADEDTDTYYDNIQDAVDAVKNGGYVVVNENYSGPISVNGAARKFTVKAATDKTVTLTAVNGANTTSDYDTSSKEYAIQLSADTVSNARVTVNSTSNGSASVNMTSAAHGSTVTITTSANSGYTPLKPTVTANNGASVNVTGSNNTWTFTVPNGATSITVTPSFVSSNSSSLPFTDVSTNAWYYDGVAYCWDTMVSGYHLMQGYNSTTFGANTPPSRADVVTVLWNISGRPVEAARYSFTDVPAGAWYYNAIAWAANHGYVNGYGDGTFQPNRYVSRQELAKILWEFEGSPIVSHNLEVTYYDGQGVADWAKAAMRWAAGNSILSGTGSVSLNGYLHAYDYAKRSEVAVTLQRLHQIYHR